MRVTMRFKKLVLVVTVFSAWHSVPTAAWAAGRLTWYLETLYVDRVLVPVPQADLRVYEPPLEVDLALLLVNDTDARVLLDQQELRRQLSVRVTIDGSSMPVPVTLSWNPEAVLRTRDRGTFEVSASERRVTLEPKDALRFALSVKRSDGKPLAVGRYRGTYEVPALSAVLSAEHGAFRDAAFDGVRPLGYLDVRPPESRAETARMHELAAIRAGDKGDGVERLRAYQRALAEDPTNNRTRLMVAYSHFAVRQYREARLLFRAILEANYDVSAVSRGILLSYVGEGDEVNAARVLRQTGTRESDIPGELSRLRDSISQVEVLESLRQRPSLK